MYRISLPATLLTLVALLVALPGWAQKPGDETASKENIEAALKLTLAAAAEYEIRAGTDEKASLLNLKREPVLKWSNPDRGEVHGNVFIWTRNGRPLAIGSLYKWFRPWTHMAHEFQSLCEEPIRATFHGEPAWKTSEPGLHFAEIPGAPAPAATHAARLLQLKQLVRDFAGTKKERDENTVVELRLLPQPIHSYSVPNDQILAGGLFAFVHGTDPEMLLLIEARGKDAAGAKWQYGVTRMTSSEARLRHKDKQLWSVEVLPWKNVSDRAAPYTSFMFKEIPDFLKEAAGKPRK